MKSRLLATLATLVLGAGVIAGITAYVANAKNDGGVTMATPAGEYTAPDGKTYPQIGRAHV